MAVLTEAAVRSVSAGGGTRVRSVVSTALSCWSGRTQNVLVWWSSMSGQAGKLMHGCPEGSRGAHCQRWRGDLSAQRRQHGAELLVRPQSECFGMPAKHALASRQAHARLSRRKPWCTASAHVPQ